MANQIKMSFDNSSDGLLESKSGKTEVSFRGNGLEPYELFLGGYASCLHATFKGIATKKKLTFESAVYDVVGVKRELVPTMLETLTTVVTITGVEESKQKAIIKSMTMAERYCSISALISKVTEMKSEIIFK